MAAARRARIPAPFGTVLVTVDREGQVRAVDLSVERQPRRVPEAFPAEVEAAFGSYLAGETETPEVPLAEPDLTVFQRDVLGSLPRIEPGQPVTYGELARRIGRPGAARAVGQALRANPLPLVWPCHRVVAADGLGGFGGASEADTSDKLAVKRWLLDHERRGDDSARRRP